MVQCHNLHKISAEAITSIRSNSPRLSTFPYHHPHPRAIAFSRWRSLWWNRWACILPGVGLWLFFHKLAHTHIHKHKHNSHCHPVVSFYAKWMVFKNTNKSFPAADSGQPEPCLLVREATRRYIPIGSSVQTNAQRLVNAYTHTSVRTKRKLWAKVMNCFLFPLSVSNLP